MSDDDTLGIGVIALRAGVSVDTVRHYEKLGLLGPARRTAAGYRRFPAGAIRQISEVRAALDLGFGLAELVVAVKARDRGLSPCRSVRELLSAKSVQIAREIAELEERRERISETLAAWDRKLADSSPGSRVGLLFGHGTSTAIPTTTGTRLSKPVRPPRPRRNQR